MPHSLCKKRLVFGTLGMYTTCRWSTITVFSCWLSDLLNQASHSRYNTCNLPNILIRVFRVLLSAGCRSTSCSARKCQPQPLTTWQSNCWTSWISMKQARFNSSGSSHNFSSYFSNMFFRGLYVGYLKLHSSLNSIRVVVPDVLPSMLPFTRVRDNPHLTKEEWEWIKANTVK